LGELILAKALIAEASEFLTKLETGANIYANALFPANTAPNLQFAHPISIQAANSLAFVSTTRTIVKNIDPSDLLSFNEIRIV
jgi:hypothetical protein